MADRRDFEALLLPHLHAAHNLACWLVRDTHVAEDLVQDAFVRALRYFDALRGEEARPWLLGIVRHNCYDWLAARRTHAGDLPLDDDWLDTLPAPEHGPGADPAAQLDGKRLRARVDEAVRALPPLFREVVVLREFEDLPYADIARITSVPVGTVMSRLARARAALKCALADLDAGAVARPASRQGWK